MTATDPEFDLLADDDPEVCRARNGGGFRCNRREGHDAAGYGHYDQDHGDVWWLQDDFDGLDPEARFLVFLHRVVTSGAVAPDGAPAVGSLVAVEWYSDEHYKVDNADRARVAGDGGAIVVEYLPDGRAVVCDEDGAYIAAEV